MSASPTRTWNAYSAVGVGVLFTLLSLLAPDWYRQEAQLQCLPSYEAKAVYPDMAQCGKAMQASPADACRCTTPQNAWAGVYANYVVPLLVGLVASLLFVGSMMARIGLLNASIWGAITVQALVYALIKPVLVVGLVLSFGKLVYIAVVASVVVAISTAIRVPTFRGKPRAT